MGQEGRPQLQYLSDINPFPFGQDKPAIVGAVIAEAHEKTSLLHSPPNVVNAAAIIHDGEFKWEQPTSL